MHPEPLFPVPAAHFSGLWTGMLDATIMGIAGGICAWLLTKAVYGAEDAFKKIPVHWVWWPAIGGLLIGIGGLIEPRSLGVGYDTIRAELAGSLALWTLVSLFIVKLLIWAIGLGSGTSGGILAPIIMMGAAIGGMLGMALPGGTPADWAVLGVVAALSGVTRSPFTSMVFAVELTHDMDLFLPLLVTATVAYLISVLILKRSILTEKVARRGFHVLREYTVDSLDVVFAREVMTTQLLNLHPGLALPEVEALLQQSSKMRYQRLLPVVDDENRLLGVVPWQDVIERAVNGNLEGKVEDIMQPNVIVTYPDASLRDVADLMALHDVGVLPVVERAAPHRLLGLITQYCLLRAHERMLVEERKREQVLHLSFPARFGRSHSHPRSSAQPASSGPAKEETVHADQPVNGSVKEQKQQDKPPLSQKPDEAAKGNCPS
jgi:CBS domain-containing protein